MSVGNILLVVIIYPVLFLLYFLAARETGVKGKPTVLGVTLAETYRNEAEVISLLADYKKSLKRWTLVAFLLPVFFITSRWLTVFITGYMLWIFGAIILIYVPFVRYHRQLRSLKMMNGWFTGKQGSEKTLEGDVWVDMKAAAEPVRMVRPWILAALSVLSAIPVIYEGVAGPVAAVRLDNALILASFASVTWLLALFMIWMDREKAEIISLNSTVNVNFERSKKRRRNMAWTQILILNTATVWLTLLFLHEYLGGMTGFMIWMGIYILLICILGIRCEFRIMKLRQKLRTDGKEQQVYVDDDSHWILGSIYYNPQDKHFMVEKRTMGIGTTINMGSRGGKIFAVIIGLLLVFCIIGIPIWIGLDEFTPISMTVEADTLAVDHVTTDYRIDLADINKVELLTELPEMSRKNGTGLPNLLKGKFEVDGKNGALVCLNPENHLFIRIETQAGQLYLLGGKTDGETEAAYEAIMAYDQ